MSGRFFCGRLGILLIEFYVKQYGVLCRRLDVGDLHVRQDAVRPAQEHRGGRTRAARHHSRTAKGLRQGDL